MHGETVKSGTLFKPLCDPYSDDDFKPITAQMVYSKIYHYVIVTYSHNPICLSLFECNFGFYCCSAL